MSRKNQEGVNNQHLSIFSRSPDPFVVWRSMLLPPISSATYFNSTASLPSILARYSLISVRCFCFIKSMLRRSTLCIKGLASALCIALVADKSTSCSYLTHCFLAFLRYAVCPFPGQDKGGFLFFILVQCFKSGINGAFLTWLNIFNLFVFFEVLLIRFICPY